MESDTLALGTTPRRVLAAGEGALLVQLEDRVCTVRKNGDFLDPICFPEEPGERLVAPAGPRKCIMLARGGVLKIYDNRKVAATQAGTLLADDEPMDGCDSGDGSIIVFTGRMAGDDLAPSAEYRFVRIGPNLEPLGAQFPVFKYRPAGWGLHLSSRRLLLLQVEPDGQKLRVLGMDKGQVEDLPRPRELEGKQITGFSVERTSGDLALTIAADRSSTVAILSPQTGRLTLLDAAKPGEAFDRPAWSLDGGAVLWRKTTVEGASLILRQPGAPTSREIARTGEGDEWFWLDENLLAIVKWDAIQRILIAPAAPN